MLDFTTKPTLSGLVVTLRPVEVADVPTLRALMADPQVGRLTGSVHSSGGEPELWTPEELTTIYNTWTTADDRIVWVILDNDNGQIVGEAVLNRLDQDNRSCGFRIWVSGATNRGLGTEAVRLSMGHAFGVVLEGTKREALRFDDGWVDCHVMGLLASEWRG